MSKNEFYYETRKVKLFRNKQRVEWMTTTEQTNNFGFCLIFQKRANRSEACRSSFDYIIGMLKMIEYVQLSGKIDSQFKSGKTGNSRRTLMCLIKIYLRNSYSHISSNSQTFTLNMQSGRS